MVMITTQAQLSRDARDRGFRPEAVVRLVDGTEVLLVSWPWFDGSGDDQAAYINCRTEFDNPLSLHRIRYFTIMQRIGDHSL